MSKPSSVPEPLPDVGVLVHEAATATVLVVDDEPRNVEVISHFLMREGFRVIAAEDGDAALLTVIEEAPDVILLDVMMPGLDGFEVCRRLKAHPATVFIPVVILTALRGASERVKGAAAGADEFLSKPFDEVELVTRVKSLLRVKRLHDQLQAHAVEMENRVAERTAELQNALDDLKELDRLKSEFISNVSHELRTPLLHVKGYVDLLAEGVLGGLTPRQTEGLGIAQEAIERLERVVEDIVDFSAVQQQRLILEPVSVADVCQNVIQTVAPLATRREVNVNLILPPDLPPVLADRLALTRALRHLLDNAIKFSPVGEAVQISAEKQKAFVRIAVHDRGEGIPLDKQEQIFDAFYQADGSTTRRAGGLGLGLALVKMLLEAHGVPVRIDSQAGIGSTFYFELLVAA